MDELDNVILMVDEDGNEVECEYIDVIEYQGKEYVVLLPIDDEEEEGEVAILEIEPISDEEEAYNTITDQATLKAVYEIFKERFKDEFNFAE